MQFKEPKDSKRYTWTDHAVEKMRYYSIFPGRVKRIIRSPERVEEGIASNTIAAMQTTGNKRTEEMWVMYQLTHKAQGKYNTADKDGEKIRIITAWRYPGESPERDPVPDEVMREVKTLL